ncbi:2og-Fe oxygenase family protein [Paraphaeosphaeria sporulosa]|uniref:2og-Fe oxygenase family protein n=1 Tax=Paraphaeosphaeria sporulosa TaxID=1460663 RepID=A0A177CEW2_9PLEO|nr:2og-Fe oxygenase family protein [Paraphaeosphaeria sporulosa]OAG05741.1 2og-Fe oxygenase family protein [Paraphaeosphaeria sporulosa]
MAPELDDKTSTKYVYFHSGSEATYRKVSEKPTGFTSIPTVDVSKIDGSLEQRKAIAAEIRGACEECGFFYIKNHAIPQEEVDEVFGLLKRFFALDTDVKMDAHVQKNPAIRGYEPMLETRLDPRTQGDVKEAFTMGDCYLEPEQDYAGKTGLQPPAYVTRPQNIWPGEAPWWREGLYKYYNAVLPLAMKLVRILALAFELEETAFDDIFRFPITGMRPLHYPPTPITENANNVGLGAHADFSWLTLVLQDSVSALEVLNQDGMWVDAPPQKGTFVCNVGQYLERHTNGTFPATVHRVRNKTAQERYSLPFFLTPDADAEIEPLECCKADGEQKYEKINVGDLYIRRILPARRKHPTSIRYLDVPQEEWSYKMLLS